MPTSSKRSNGQKPSRTKKPVRVNVVADFETTTDPNDCRVWGWAVCYIDDHENVVYGHTIEEFIDYISGLDLNVYFHNLKFDGTFIVDWLLKNGYSHQVGLDSLPYRGFRTLISDSGKFYSMATRWATGNNTEFRDSLKKLPMDVMRIAQAFKLGEVKGDIDYHVHRPIGHVMTHEERDYIRRDVQIVAQAMKEVIETGMTKLTVASDSMAEYKRIMTGSNFERFFPVFNDEMDAEIRTAYRGGFTYAAERFQGKMQGSGIVLDVNSLYPHVMRTSQLPYGLPEFVEGRVEPTETRPLTIFRVTFTAKLKPEHIPCIQVKGGTYWNPAEYLKVIDEPTTLTVTNVDWALFTEHYDITVLEWLGGWRFKSNRGFFDKYIDKWADVKANSSGGKREIAKLHLNSLYGKFASNPNVTSKFPVLRDGAVQYKRGPDETRPPVYTPMGIFITAYARDLTIRAAQANYDTFAYADTDSLHLLRDDVPETIDVHESRMGAWKLEYKFENAFYVRAKAYLERKSDGEYVNRIAGLPLKVSALLTFEDVKSSLTITADWVRKRTGDSTRSGKLTPKAVPGGVVLQDTPFKLHIGR